MVVLLLDEMARLKPRGTLPAQNCLGISRFLFSDHTNSLHCGHLRKRRRALLVLVFHTIEPCLQQTVGRPLPGALEEAADADAAAAPSEVRLGRALDLLEESLPVSLRLSVPPSLH